MTPYWPSLDKDDITVSTDSPAVDDPLDCDVVRHLAQQHLSSHAIDYLVDRISDAVDYGLGRPSTSASQRYVRAQRQQDRIEFAAFVSKILRRAEVTMSVLLGALVYVDRAKQHLRIAIEEWAHHRVFLGALIAASKYLNDSSLKNAHWAICTGLFGKRDIARIEREFLEVLDFELSVHAADILKHENGLARAGALKTPEPTSNTNRGRKLNYNDRERSRQSSRDLAHATFASPSSCPESPASATSTAYSSSTSSSTDLSGHSTFASSRPGSTSPPSSSEDEPYTPPPPHHRTHRSANLFFPLPNPHPKPMQLYSAPQSSAVSRSSSYPHVQYKNAPSAQVLKHVSSTGAAAAAAVSLYPSCVVNGSGSAASSRAASPMFVDYAYAVPAVA